MMDDPDLEGYNVDERVATLVDRAMERFAWTRGNDIMLTMGSDFHYGNAFHWYKVRGGSCSVQRGGQWHVVHTTMHALSCGDAA